MRMTPLDKLLSLLFDQYKREFQPRFVSRLYTWLGNRMLGSTDLKGLDDVMPELQGSYFNAIIDRRPPRDREAIAQWDKGSRLTTPVRFVEERYAGKGMFALLVPVTFACCLGAWGVHSIKSKWHEHQAQDTSMAALGAGPASSKEQAPAKRVPFTQPGPPPVMSEQDCYGLRVALENQTIFLTDPGVFSKSEVCRKQFQI